MSVSKLRPERAQPPLAALLALMLALLAAGAAADRRQVYTAQPATWLQAVGKLRVPVSRLEAGRRKHFYEDCSATLVARAQGLAANHILTAWHCLEFYNDLSRSIVFTIPYGNAAPVTRRATRIADGGGMHADWALLRLNEPVPLEYATPMRLRTRSAHSGGITLAGFSRDKGLGQGGLVLTYDARCELTSTRSSSHETNCTAFKGASGGPAVQANENGEMQLSGVISQGDGNGVSTYISTAAFASRVLPLLN